MEKKSVLNKQIFNDIQRAVKFQVESTKKIYDCQDEKALNVFTQELTKNMLQTYHEQLEEKSRYNISSTSASEYPTSNIFRALIKSGIKKDGLLPEGRCYLTKITEGDGKFLEEDKYNDEKSDVERRAANISNWVKENEDTDPNMYELMDLFITAGKYENDLSEDTKNQLQYLKEKRMKDLTQKVGVSPENDLYKMCNSVCDNTLAGVPTTFSSNVKEYVCKLASVNLYIEQMKRDNKEFTYNNKVEFEQIANLKKQIEKDDEILPSGCENIFDNINKNLQVEKGFIGELKKMTVDANEIPKTETKSVISNPGKDAR